MKEMNIIISKNGELVDSDIMEFSFVESNGFIQMGIEFCPREVCRLVNNIEVIHQTFLLDIDEEIDELEQNDNILCFNIFNRLFTELIKKDLVEDFSIDELECFIEASHHKYSFLKNITPIVSENYYGLGFNIIDLPFDKLIAEVEEVKTWLNEVIIILNSFKEDFELLKNDSIIFKIKNYLYLDLND